MKSPSFPKKVPQRARKQGINTNMLMDNSAKIECLFCRGLKVSINPDWIGTNDGVIGRELKYVCGECGAFFDGWDIIREDIRRRMSALLSETSEEKRMDVEIVSNINGQRITQLWQTEDGIIYAKWGGLAVEFDEFDTDEMEEILRQLY